MAKHKDSGDKVALKIIKAEMMEYISMDEIKEEVNVLKQLDHKHITRLVDHGYADLTSKGKSNEVFYIALEVCAGGELFDFISMTGSFTERVARYYFLQLLDALEFMHKTGLSHRDLKTENILLDKNFNLKVADFGYASGKSSNTTQVGTEDYMAPEILKGKHYSGQVADIFGMGLILFMMCAQSKAFLKAESNDVYYKNLVVNRPDKFWREHTKSRGSDYFSEEFKNLVTQLFAYNPIHRPSIAEIRRHAWFSGDIATKSEVHEEFDRRKEELDAELKRQKEEDPTQAEFDPSIFDGNTVHRGIGGEEEDVKEDVEREVMEYDPDCKRYTQFFSTSDLSDLWSTLAGYISSVTNDFKFSADEYSVSAKLVPDVDESNDESSKSQLKFEVNILKVEDQDKYCVEATVLEGNQFEFSKVFMQMKSFFAGHANATETE